MVRKQYYDYAGREIDVRFEPKRCIHAAECIHGLPDVFDRSGKPWIDPDKARAENVAEVVTRCPTGALQFERKDGGMVEPTPEVNVATVVSNGPIYLKGRLRIELPGGESRPETRLALCRCGHSAYKPFCDNSHQEVSFEDEGSIGAAMLGQMEPDAEQEELALSLAPNGPVLIRGQIEIRSADGESSQAGTKGALCRCGASQNKPYCDGSHVEIGFQAD